VEKQVQVPDVSCEHCARAIRNELSPMPGVGRVEVDVAARRLTVQFDAPATWDALAAALTDIGYPPRE
jgi:copper chaperone CopZ